MNELLNGQVLAALSPWQGATLIVLSIALGYGCRRLHHARRARP
jgi:hypothetical protein